MKPPPEVKVDERQIRDLIREYSPSTEPPKRKRNILRVLAILFAVALFAGFVLYGLLQIEEAIASGNIDAVQEQIKPPPKEQTVIIQIGEEFVPYPKTRAEVADRFGGNPKDWSQNWWIGGWVYTSDTTIEIPIAPNATVYSNHLILSWL